MNYFGGFTTCAQVDGQDAIFFDNHIARQKRNIKLYLSTCKQYEIRFTGHTKHGFYDFLNYTFDLHAYTNRLDDKNYCYCHEYLQEEGFFNVKQRKREAGRMSEGSQKCLRRCDGLHDLSDCMQAPGLSVSWPHFLDAPHLVQALGTGIEPVQWKHLPTMLIDPLTGVANSGAFKYQLNLRMDFAEMATDHYEVRHVNIMPYVWFIEVTDRKGCV